jgi:hypothetical protein
MVLASIAAAKEAEIEICNLYTAESVPIAPEKSREVKET